MVESELVTSRGNRMEPNFEGRNSFLISKRLEGKEREGEREREREKEKEVFIENSEDEGG